MNVIVVAAICLIVLIVMIIVFKGAISDIMAKFKSTTAQAGKEGDKGLADLFPKESQPQNSGANPG